MDKKLIVKGLTKDILSKTAQMWRVVEIEEYENAAILRDEIAALQQKMHNVLNQ